MSAENIISFGLGALAINVKIASVMPDIQTPLENMFSATDIHEIILSGIKVVVAGLLSVLINKFFTKKAEK
jgi:hypothetical protein